MTVYSHVTLWTNTVGPLLQMKVDSATNTKRNGWRRMTFVDVEDERAVKGGAKTLASYELQKASRGLGGTRLKLFVVCHTY